MGLEMKRIKNFHGFWKCDIYNNAPNQPNASTEELRKAREDDVNEDENLRVVVDEIPLEILLIAAKGLLRKLLGNVPNNGARVVPNTLNPQV